jgi:hypothetical protein
MTRSTLIKSTLALSVVATLGCTNDITSSLALNGPVGAYTAIILYSTSASDPSLQLPSSGTFTINLAADGTTTGHLHLAAFNGNPAVDADMAGTWTRTGNTVNFQQDADTFVSAVPFTIQVINDQVWSLVADDVFEGTRFNVTLMPAHST